MVIHKNSQDVISKTTKIVYSGIFFVIIPRLDRADGATRVFLINYLSYTQNTATVSVKDLYLLPPYHSPKPKFLMLTVTILINLLPMFWQLSTMVS